MKRFVIYFYYHPRNVLDKTCLLMLRAVCRCAQGALLVVNGTLPPSDAALAEQAGASVLLRQNVGFDVGAYKQALEHLGRAAFAGYDELVLMNYTIAGPVYPLEKTFAQMDARPELDFWGLTRHYEMKSRRFRTEYGVVPEHLQSHFLAVRARLLQSDDFWDYWRAMRQPKSYEQAVAFHEARFTRHFALLGYRWDTSVDTSDLREAFVNPLMACPQELLARRGCPVFKRRSFFTDYADELRRTDGAAAAQLYAYLKEHTGYPVDTLVAELLPVQPLHTLAQNLHWRRVLPMQRAPAAQDRNVVLLCVPKSGSAQGAAAWYTQKVREWFLEPQVQAAVQAMFAAQPRLGLVSPDAPQNPEVACWRRREWKRLLPALKQRKQQLGLNVLLEEDEPLYAPFAGCAVVRRSVVEQAAPGLLEKLAKPESWPLLALAAQSAGYASMAVYSAAQAGAHAQMLAVSLREQGAVASAARTLGRAVKRSWQERGEGRL